MQTFIVKLGCLFLFGFIFFSAYQTNIEADSLSIIEESPKATTILISNTTSVTETEFVEQVASPLKFN